MNKSFTLLYICLGIITYGQNTPKDSSQFIDSLIKNNECLAKNKVINLKTIDSLWIEKLYRSSLFENLYDVCSDKDSIQPILKLSDSLLKKRLENLDAKTPFHLSYNPILKKIIASYLKNKHMYYPRMLARAMYYFPLFENILNQFDMPLEIKYLAIVESALNPRAKSLVGARGLWQFMYQTGKQFDLKISSYVDERQDPERSTIAACKYLQDLYSIFKDWDLALAAYNSGPGNVTKAIRRSGGYKNYWNIRPFLPRETADYVPAFYAIYYIFSYAKEHRIHPEKPIAYQFDTDTIAVKQLLTFQQISKSIGTDIEVLQFLNPAYKLDIIPFIKNKKYTLRLPKKDMFTFIEKEKEIYALAKKESEQRERPLPKYLEMNHRIRYKVRYGDYLGKIARKYGVSIAKIKKWNGMRSSKIRTGQRLTIYPRRF